MREQKHIFQNIDWLMIIIYLLLIFIGWLNIYASCYNEERKNILDMSQKYGKEIVWIGSALLIALAILIIDGKFYSAFAYFIYVMSILFLISVLFFGNKTSGSQSWFQVGEFKLQPAEFAKFATSLAIARYLSSFDIKLKEIKTKLMLGILLGIPLIFIILQNDTGSALVFLAFFLVFYREGLTGNLVLILGLLIITLFLMTLLIDKFILSSIIACLLLIIYLLFRKAKRIILYLSVVLILTVGFVFSVDYIFNDILKPHQKDRINVLLGKKVDPKGIGYNVNQSKIAIGSGGFLGKGFLQGTQTKFDFVPEQSTDFIFCTVGEEWGFLGSIFVIGLFLGLIVRIVFVAERQRSAFSRIYGYGVAAILFFHIVVNIGMTIGIIPVIGIPLPFFSYGGSSLWAFTILLFIFIKLDAYRLMLL
ncbi:MAG: rod shape-determining protein RodA [Bacteroidales bacterium]|nr:rod shape-determining protein RodA [Bacteroidales bacterium]